MGASLEAGVIENRGLEKTSRVGFRDFRSQGAVLIHEERISNVSHALVMLVHIVFYLLSFSSEFLKFLRSQMKLVHFLIV